MDCSSLPNSSSKSQVVPGGDQRKEENGWELNAGVDDANRVDLRRLKRRK